MSKTYRVPRKTCVLARILKRHVGQEQNLQLLIRSVNASGLKEGDEGRGRERDRKTHKPQTPREKRRGNVTRHLAEAAIPSPATNIASQASRLS